MEKRIQLALMFAILAVAASTLYLAKRQDHRFESVMQEIQEAQVTEFTTTFTCDGEPHTVRTVREANESASSHRSRHKQEVADAKSEFCS